jgi:hypothetical protein
VKAIREVECQRRNDDCHHNERDVVHTPELNRTAQYERPGPPAPSVLAHQGVPADRPQALSTPQLWSLHPAGVPRLSGQGNRVPESRLSRQISTNQTLPDYAEALARWGGGG